MKHNPNSESGRLLTKEEENTIKYYAMKSSWEKLFLYIEKLFDDVFFNNSKESYEENEEKFNETMYNDNAC